MHQEYIDAIVSSLSNCKDVELLDLILRLLQDS